MTSHDSTPPPPLPPQYGDGEAAAGGRGCLYYCGPLGVLIFLGPVAAFFVQAAFVILGEGLLHEGKWSLDDYRDWTFVALVVPLSLAVAACVAAGAVMLAAGVRGYALQRRAVVVAIIVGIVSLAFLQVTIPTPPRDIQPSLSTLGARVVFAAILWLVPLTFLKFVAGFEEGRSLMQPEPEGSARRLLSGVSKAAAACVLAFGLIAFLVDVLSRY